MNCRRYTFNFNYDRNSVTYTARFFLNARVIQILSFVFRFVLIEMAFNIAHFKGFF